MHVAGAAERLANIATFYQHDKVADAEILVGESNALDVIEQGGSCASHRVHRPLACERPLKLGSRAISGIQAGRLDVAVADECHGALVAPEIKCADKAEVVGSEPLRMAQVPARRIAPIVQRCIGGYFRIELVAELRGARYRQRTKQQLAQHDERSNAQQAAGDGGKDVLHSKN